MEIKTNNHWRHFKYSYEVPESVFNDYDWLSEDESLDGWIHYRNVWRHISDFTFGDYHGWHGAVADCAFWGVVIRTSEDGEQYQIGTWSN
jgi:hypothetical protein